MVENSTKYLVACLTFMSVVEYMQVPVSAWRVASYPGVLPYLVSNDISTGAQGLTSSMDLFVKDV